MCAHNGSNERLGDSRILAVNIAVSSIQTPIAEGDEEKVDHSGRTIDIPEPGKSAEAFVCTEPFITSDIGVCNRL